MSRVNVTTEPDCDGEEAFVRPPDTRRDPEGTVAIVGAAKHSRLFDTRAAFVDREGAVSLIEALTAAVDAADMREAAEAERIAREECRRIREAAKLKRGDAVRLKNTMSRTLYTVVTDEDEDGRVDLVRIVSPLGAGRLVTGERAGQFERIPE